MGQLAKLRTELPDIYYANRAFIDMSVFCDGEDEDEKIDRNDELQDECLEKWRINFEKEKARRAKGKARAGPENALDLSGSSESGSGKH